MQRRVGLRPLLLGPTLVERSQDRTLDALDAHIHAVAELLPQVYGDAEPMHQAQLALHTVANIGSDRDAVLCKRAALLFALLHEKEPVRHFAAEERAQRNDPCDEHTTYAEDMRERVLPFVVPWYLRDSCQSPDAFVTLACVLAELWPGEPLGNWPLPAELGSRGVRGDAHHDFAAG